MLPGNTTKRTNSNSGGEGLRSLKKNINTGFLNTRLFLGRTTTFIVVLCVLCVLGFFLVDRIATYIAAHSAALQEVKTLRVQREHMTKELKKASDKQTQFLSEIEEFQKKLEETNQRLQEQHEFFRQQLVDLHDQQEMMNRLMTRHNRSRDILQAASVELNQKVRTLEAEEARIKSLQGQSHYVQPVAAQPQAVEATPLPAAIPIDYSIPPEQRKEAVTKAIKYAWDSYKKHAWGQDELRPISKTAQNWVGMGLTIVDSLDTLWLAGLKEEFDDGRNWVSENLHFDKYSRPVSVFETTIRVLGGLLSAYELSEDKMFLDKAVALGERLLLSFGNANNKFPSGGLNFVTGQMEQTPWAGGAYILSEVGTLQLEFLYLAVKANRPDLAVKVLEVYIALDKMPKSDNQYFLYVRPDGQWGSQQSSIGALGDSFYEYLLKMWLITGKKVPGFRRMYDNAMKAVKKYMLKHSSPGGLAYLAEVRNGAPFPKMDHLACFAGGMFALGANGDEEEFTTGAKITETCHEIYRRQPTGIGPEHVVFQDGIDFTVPGGASHYLLRPETMESYFVLWRLTKEQKYRDWGWEAFCNMERVLKTENGYSGIRDVRMGNSAYYDDMQQTFFIAETLKYLLLLFSEDDVIPLDKYVFNTEAHPLGILDIEYSEIISRHFPPDEFQAPDLDTILKAQHLQQLQSQKEQWQTQVNVHTAQHTSFGEQYSAVQKEISDLMELQELEEKSARASEQPSLSPGALPLPKPPSQYAPQMSILRARAAELKTQLENSRLQMDSSKAQLKNVEIQLAGGTVPPPSPPPPRQRSAGSSPLPLPPPPPVVEDPNDPKVIARQKKREAFKLHQDLLKQQQDILTEMTDLQKQAPSEERTRRSVLLQTQLQELQVRLQEVSGIIFGSVDSPASLLPSP